MSRLSVCVRCEGLVPPGRAACPHCDQVGPRGPGLLRRLAAVAGGGAIAVTLMACYGGPPRCEPGTDKDGDHACSRGPGRIDCNDDDPNIRPLANDPPGDGIDQNCDGVDGDAPAPPAPAPP